MINWNKYFDHIFCIHYISEDRIERHHQLINELSRVGIYQSGIFSFIYDEDSKLNNKLFEDIKINTANCVQSYAKRVTINHYKALNISKLLGYKNILIIEDDIVFLKDLQEIEKILEENYNKEFDICQYDYINYSNMWYAFATCYQIKNDGINKLIKNIENEPMYVIDQYFSRTNSYTYHDSINVCEIKYPYLLNLHISNKRLAIQRNNNAYDNCGININYDEYEN